MPSTPWKFPFNYSCSGGGFFTVLLACLLQDPHGAINLCGQRKFTLTEKRDLPEVDSKTVGAPIIDCLVFPEI